MKNQTSIILVVLIFFVILFGSLFAYKEYKKPVEKKEMLDQTNEVIKELLERLNKGGYCAKTLYDHKIGTVTSTNLEISTKFIMSYQNVKEVNRKTVACNELKPSEIFPKEDLQYETTCGESAYSEHDQFVTDDHSISKTTVILEKDLKDAWELLFGPDTYKRVNSVMITNARWTYIDRLKGYALGHTQMGGTCAGIEETFVSAYQEKNQIVITTNVVYSDALKGEDTTNYTYTYFFQKKNNDKQYYFEKLKKEA